MNKIILSFLLVIASLFTFVFPAYAKDGEASEGIEIVRSLSETTIEEDFSYLKDVEGNTFDESNYPAIPYTEPKLLTVVEDCKLIEENPEYTLYFYIYNPGLYDINFAIAPKVQLSFDGTSYYKFSATRFGDANTGPFYKKTEDSRFLKFKVSPDKAYWENLDKNFRTVYFSGFELSILKYSNFQWLEFCTGTYFGDSIGNSKTSVKFIFEGNNPSKMTKAIGIDALILDLNLTYYRTTNENSDQGELNQLMTAYFMIPKSYFNDYGMISNIHYEYEKYSDVPLLVSDFDVFNYKLPTVYFYGTVHVDLISQVGSHLTVFAADKVVSDDALNEYFDIDLGIFTKGSLWPDQPNSFFKTYKTAYRSGLPLIRSDSLKVSSESLNEYFRVNNYYLSNPIHFDKNVSSNNPEDFLKSESYVSSGNLWDRLQYFGLYGLKMPDDSYNVAPIVVVDEDDYEMIKCNDQLFSQKYRIEEVEVPTIRKAANYAKKHNCYLVLLRFDVSSVSTQRLNYRATLYENSFGNDVWGFWDLSEEEVKNNKGEIRRHKENILFTKNTVYQNFDVIDITFQNDQGSYVIPVVANPVEIYVPPTITPDDVNNKLGLGDRDINYIPLLILTVSFVVVLALTPSVSSFFGRIFGTPLDKVLRRNRNRRK